MDLVEEKMADLGRMIGSEVNDRLAEVLEELAERNGNLTETEKVLQNEIGSVARRINIILSEWLGKGQEPREEHVDAMEARDSEE